MFCPLPVHEPDARERLRGYRQCIRQLGVAPQEVAGDFTEAAGHAAAVRILETSPRATAIFAANDAMAVGALAALAEAGLDVPGRMAVTGFDDIPIARYVAPPLTTIRQPMSEMGRLAMRAVLDLLSGSGATHEIRVRGELIVRASTGPRRADSCPGARLSGTDAKA